MKPAFKISLALIVTLATLISCNKEKEEIIPIADLTKNAMYINGTGYSISEGMIIYDGSYNFETFDFGLYLFSDGISFSDDEFSGTGDFVVVEFTSSTWEFPTSSTYFVDDIICGINFEVETWLNDHFYGFNSATMTILKDESNYEITINGSGTEYDDNDNVLVDGVQLQVHYKGALNEIDFPTEDPTACQIDVNTLDFTFGVDYDNPNKYLIAGDQSNLSDDYLKVVQDAIGTPSNTVEGILEVCHWVNQNFTFQNEGGGMAHIKTADELFEEKKFYGCHTQALIISSILRKFGFPILMIETADIDWAYDARDGDVDYMAGHVMSEVFVDNHWVLLDNNCTYVNDYDYGNPYIPISFTSKGLFVVGKGVDIWSYSSNNDNFTDENLWHIAENLSCYEPLFNSVNYSWSN